MHEIILDPVFKTLPSEVLPDLARCLSYDPWTSEQRPRPVRNLPDEEKLRWFDMHRGEIEQEFCRIGSWTFSETKTYAEIVRKLAKKLGIRGLGGNPAAIERAIIAKVWNETLAKLTPEQAADLKARAAKLAAEHGRNFGGELTAAAAMSAAQLSGFGVYLLGSTLLGGLNSALGLGLGFGAFTSLSSAISTVIGPVGWACLGLFTVFRLGSPNYKKILPAVILIAINRPEEKAVPFWRGKHAVVIVLVVAVFVLLIKACSSLP
jgi:uncharacterized protein YaaW (UPF0174 family)